MLAVDNLGVRYGNLTALDGVSLSVAPDEIVTVVGANGAGKSTLMRAVLGLVQINSGTISFDGQDITRLPTFKIARKGIALVPEGRGPLRQLSVRENLVLGAFSRAWDAATKADFEAVLDRFPALRPRLAQTAGTLSGGEQQMLVIGRALMSRPKLMLLDEPSLGLAPLIVAQVFATIEAVRGMGVAVVVVEQNAHAALKLADRAYVIENGRIVLEGSNLLGDKRVQEAYLGGSVA
ncbi:ABC transporter ATP-binding protein [Roseiarcaceae bacterium H3SJ34-1]|uniref:ABC transporter ATP-binding protein n=1 Tax=Terripilifer ovatus TaxID=3032367 RepID=UPI003AB93232|nr:ABC transporter ATP-binding protein [Roseiarcaceae bacterium H3SJ34-1]